MTIQVPSQYVSLLQEMSNATGIPYNVEAAQADQESGFDASIVSNAGAEGWLQFLPSTYNEYASQAGVPEGTEFNAADEAKVYDVYMSALLKEYNGSVQNALAAYNAGTANSTAGQEYATTILDNAGERSSVVATPNASQNPASTTAGIDWNPLSWGNTILGDFLNALGITTENFVPILERGALMLFGGILIIIGVLRISSGAAEKIVVQTVEPDASEGETNAGQQS